MTDDDLMTTVTDCTRMALSALRPEDEIKLIVSRLLDAIAHAGVTEEELADYERLGKRVSDLVVDVAWEAMAAADYEARD